MVYVLPMPSYPHIQRYRADKERVIDLLRRVWDDEGNLVVFGDRDKHEWSMPGLSQWFSRPNDLEEETAW